MVKKLLLIICIFLLACFLGYVVLLIQSEENQNPEIAAHRGDSSEFPENTLSAFQSAFDKGVDYIEIDLHQTKDNQIVVIHDEAVDRTTNGTGLVRDYLYSDLALLETGNGEKIPLFEEVILLVKKNKKKMLIEIKSPQLYPGIEKRVFDLIKKNNIEKEVIIGSFDHDYLERFHKSYPAIALCPVYDWKTLYIKDIDGASYYCIPAENVLINPWLIYGIHKNGDKAFVWFQFFENALSVKILKLLGVDGLIIEDL